MTAGREFTRPAILAAFSASVGMFVGSTPMLSATASLFMAALAADFGLSRTTISAIMLSSPITVAVLLPYAGRLLDRLGVRRVVLPVVLMFGFAHVALYFTAAPWQVVLLYVFLGVCGSVHNYPSYTKIVALWFDQYRGRVLGFMIAFGSGLGAALMPQLVRAVIADQGWRVAYLYLAAIILLWGLPILFAFLREPETGPGRHYVPVDRPGLTRGQAMKTRPFWTITVAIFLAPMAVIGTVAHSFPMLTERGLDPLTATSTLSVLYIGGMCGQLLSGFLLDRINSPRIVLPFFLAAFVGVTLLHTTASSQLLFPGGFLLGMAQGSEVGIAAYLASRYFGLKAYGAIYGVVFGVATFGVAVGILLMGVAHDASGSYDVMRFVFPTNLAIAVLLLSTLGPYVYDPRRKEHSETK